MKGKGCRPLHPNDQGDNGPRVQKKRAPHREPWQNQRVVLEKTQLAEATGSTLTRRPALSNFTWPSTKAKIV